MKHQLVLGVRMLLVAWLVGLFIGCTSHSSEPDILVWTTDVTRAYDLHSDTISFMNDISDSTLTIRVDSTRHFQSIDGFGAAITGSTAYNLSLMPDSVRKKFLRETFSSDGYGLSYVRVSIGCSDFSLSDYTCCDKKGVQFFSLTSEETEYVIPILQQILSIRPDLKIMATPWTAPRWMKVKDLKSKKPYPYWTGGHLNPDYYQDYAEYFVRWIKAFNEAGIPIYSITPQNEPLNPGNSASMLMYWDEERDFIKTALGPALHRAGLDYIKIYIFDHNYNYDDLPLQAQYPLHIYEDSLANVYITGTAYHNYGGHRSEMTRIHEAYPEKELMFSEASIGVWNAGRDLSRSLLRDVEELAIGTVNNWAVGAIVWNLVLDSDQGPHGGPGACATCYGAVDVDNKTYSVITRNSHYYAMAHIATVVSPGAVRIASSSNGDSSVGFVAFRNENGTLALVVTNHREKEQAIMVNDGTRSFTHILPPRSVTSLRW